MLAMEMWFTYATRLSEIIFEEKLALYEDLVSHYLQAREEYINKLDKVAFSEEYESECSKDNENSNNNLDKMNVANMLRLSSHARAQKTNNFIDEVECEKERVYYTLWNGYVVCEEDVQAAKQSIVNLHKLESNSNIEVTDTSKVNKDSATIDLTLLYGELTSRGTRQLIDVFHRKCAVTTKTEDFDKVQEEIKEGKENCKAQVIDHTCVIDVGTGTGKLLFEWSRLAVQPANLVNNNKSQCWSEILHNVKCNNQEWSGLGIELAPSRYRIAIEALKPFVDNLTISINTNQESKYLCESNNKCKIWTDAALIKLEPLVQTNVDKCKKDVDVTDTEETTSTKHETCTEVEQSNTTKCDAARCALYNGDVFTPHLLTFDTMQQFVHYYINMDNNYKSNTYSKNGKSDNYYYDKYLQNDQIEIYHVHLCVFCCGLGFDECFIRKLCGKLEELILESNVECENNNHLLYSKDHSSTNKNGKKALHHVEWQSITCFLLLRNFDVQNTLYSDDFPLFRCCMDWDKSTHQFIKDMSLTKNRSITNSNYMHNDTYKKKLPEDISTKLKQSGISYSSVELIELETTWMAAAPTWVLHFARQSHQQQQQQQ